MGDNCKRDRSDEQAIFTTMSGHWAAERGHDEGMTEQYDLRTNNEILTILTF